MKSRVSNFHESLLEIHQSCAKSEVVIFWHLTCVYLACAVVSLQLTSVSKGMLNFSCLKLRVLRFDVRRKLM